MALGTAFLTAFYTFRAYFLTFFGPQQVPEEAGHHAHESPPVMWGPLVVLAIFAFAIGFVVESGHRFADYLASSPSLFFLQLQEGAHSHAGEFHLQIAVISTIVAVAGDRRWQRSSTSAVNAKSATHCPAHWTAVPAFASQVFPG